MLLIGGNDAGKSNYIGRFWLAVRSGTGRLERDGSPDDQEYLESLAQPILSGEFAPHTSHDVHNRSIIPVRSRVGQPLAGQLTVPDCSGEQWLKMYKKRSWARTWDDFITEGSGCLLFIRVDSEQNVSPMDWIAFHNVFQSTTATVQPQTEETPTQVVAVDWLQCLRKAYTDRVGGSYRPRAGIVLTAWDLIPEDRRDIGPDGYLRENYPLLKDFMESCGRDFDFCSFGVSVFGGDPQHDTVFKEKYLEDALNAGYVVHSVLGSLRTSADMTLPVAWTLGAELEA